MPHAAVTLKNQQPWEEPSVALQFQFSMPWIKASHGIMESLRLEKRSSNQTLDVEVSPLWFHMIPTYTTQSLEF